MTGIFTTGTASTNYQPGQLMLGGLACGVLANILLWPTGLMNAGFAMWLALFIAIALCLLRNAGAVRFRIVAMWSAVALSAALVLTFRSSEFLLPLMWLVILAAAAIALMQLRGTTLRDSLIRDFLLAPLKIPVQALVPFPLLLRQFDYPGLSRSLHAQGIVRGVLIALPLLLIFTLLFASADAGFSRLLPDASWFFSTSLPGRLALIAVVSWVATGLLQGVCTTMPTASLRKGWQWQLGATEITVVMGTLSALFLLFVCLQLGYLFGGTEIIMATTGLTLADYARRGFFELLAVASLTLIVLLVLGAVSGGLKLYRICAAVLVLCVLIILASAAQRLYLYMDAYGLTLSRVVAVAFMGWLALCLLLFGAMVLREKSAGFAAATVLSGIGTVMLLALANPAAVVTAVNIERAVEFRQQNAAYVPPPPGFGNVPVIMRFPGIRQIDIDYLLALGADAVPALLAHLEALNPAEQCRVARGLLDQWQADDGPAEDWRSWNASRAHARETVNAMAPRLQEKISVFSNVIDQTIPRPVIARLLC